MIPLPNHADFEAMLRPRRPTEEGFDKEYDPWVVVCFSATWCGPCKRLDKKTLVAQTSRIKWYAVDVDENQTTLGYCGLQSIPSFCLLKDGIFKDRKSGAADVQDVIQWLAKNGAPVPLQIN